jgi:hypothetical protein
MSDVGSRVEGQCPRILIRRGLTEGWGMSNIPYAILRTRAVLLLLLHPNQLAHIIASAGGFGQDGFFHFVC